MKKTAITIAVADNHLDNILEVAHLLQEAGLKVEHIMDAVGVITGSCETCEVEKIAQIDGVESVEAQDQYRLAPPDAPIQ
ncbi:MULTISPECIES: ketohydroxyglutarate aldolase [unclassified Leptolyngbya]|uniref:ketohydroxyglutarate aldolase n=1 Tax=unclassified Leptolyngbya TaxID=2650499 RepID=UPI001684CAF1|nr:MULTISPECIES: ketohydroxyglutarate aldolase [unclassified Leptolyngbya]MBD1914145.1 ketohydroxyglutarate aldolase [Leptolyngbya sp. FACHB-8]MBD2157469.1 ketohydroxyglutarate aldolase [Leptolyngbya sp. FACHB-16]